MHQCELHFLALCLQVLLEGLVKAEKAYVSMREGRYKLMSTYKCVQCQCFLMNLSAEEFALFFDDSSNFRAAEKARRIAVEGTLQEVLDSLVVSCQDLVLVISKTASASSSSISGCGSYLGAQGKSPK